MQDNWPQIIRDVGFNFRWDEKKVWALNLPVTEIKMKELEWHFDIPFLSKDGGIYNLTPREVMNHPELHNEEYRRMLATNLRHPIDVMENKGRWLILDGLHRLMKIRTFSIPEMGVWVRVVPREKIPEILKD